MQILTQLLENVSACEDLRGCAPVAHSWWTSRQVDAKHSLGIRNVATFSSREALHVQESTFAGKRIPGKVALLILCSAPCGLAKL